MSYLTLLAERGITLQADGDRLIVESLHPLKDDERNFIRSHKSTLLEEINQRESPSPPQEGKLLQVAEDLDLPLVKGLRDDTGFVNGLLAYRTPAERHMLLTEYRERWLEAADGEQLEHRKNNAGRRAANTWLRTRLH